MASTLPGMNIPSVAWSAASVMLRTCNSSSVGTEENNVILAITAFCYPLMSSIVNASLAHFDAGSGTVASGVGVLWSLMD